MMERTGVRRTSRVVRRPATKESTMDNRVKTTSLMGGKAVRNFHTGTSSVTYPSASVKAEMIE